MCDVSDVDLQRRSAKEPTHSRFHVTSARRAIVTEAQKVQDRVTYLSEKSDVYFRIHDADNCAVVNT